MSGKAAGLPCGARFCDSLCWPHDMSTLESWAPLSVSVDKERLVTAEPRGAAPSHVRILQQNCWTEDTDRGRRTEDLIQGILVLDPAIVCLQEVVTRDVKGALWKKLTERYHILSTDYTVPSFPPLAYLPCVLVTVVAVAVVLGWGQSILGFTVLGWAAALLVLSPHGLFSCASFVITKRTTPSLDLMGQSVLVRRAAGGHSSAGWASVRVVGVHPFSHKLRGYPAPTSFKKALFYWAQHCFFRPGFIVVHATEGHGGCQDAWILSAHLVVSKPKTDRNPNRLPQVEHMHAILSQHMAATKSCNGSAAGPLVLVAGDFNAPGESPEVGFMGSAGFTDACAPGASWTVEPQISFRTWHRDSNPYTASDVDEPDNRLDYVFVAGKGARCVKAERVFDGGKLPLVSDHFGVLATLELKK
eukprot:COSAG04_NODE_2712_length_3696_cov_54.879344_2_plen_416_part_00